MLLALSLADFANDDGTSIYPSIKNLAEKTRQSERSVQYQLRKMEESGWLILVNSGNGGRNQHREYRIAESWIKGADFAPVQSTTEKGASDDVKGASDSTKGCSPLHPHIPVIEPSIPINKPSSAKPVPEKAANRFQEFWETYPSTGRKVAKSKCLEVWKAKKLDLVADDVLSHLRAIQTTPQWLGGYEPAPLTYLNQKRWEDEIPTARQTGASKHGNFGRQDYRAGIDADGSF